MIRFEKALIRLETDLRGLQIRWALIGGLAVSLRAEPRTTRDIDLAVVVSGDREAEEVAKALLFRGYRESESGGVLEQKDVGRLAGVRFLTPGSEESAVGVDLLFASSGIEPEIAAAAEKLSVLPGLYAPVARTGHLIALKILAGRDKDRADLRLLLAQAGPSDLQLARESLVLIDRRGYHRGQDLMGDLARLLSLQE